MSCFIKKLMCTLVVYLLASQMSLTSAKEVIAIISDELNPIPTHYMIFQNASTLMAQEIASIINQHGRIRAYSLSNSLSNSEKFNMQNDIRTFLKEYQNSYTINYPALRKVANRINAEYVLLISTKVDAETQFLERTKWNSWAIAGENSVNPTYRLLTNITLVNPEKEQIMLTKNYDQSIKSKNFDLATPMFPPTAAQLNKIQDLSIKMANEMTPTITYAIRPDLKPQNSTIKDKVETKVQTIWHSDPVYSDEVNYKNPPKDFKTKILDSKFLKTPEDL